METNNIYLGDAYELIKQIPDKSVDLIMTDPPYLIKGLQQKNFNTGLFKHRTDTHANELKANGLGEGILLPILDEMVRVLKNINIYIWCNKEQIYEYLNYFVKNKKCNFEIIIWAKSNPTPFTNGHYLKDKEYCLFFWGKGTKVGGSYQTLSTCYLSSANIEDKNKFLHPCIKPINIITNLIKNSANKGDVVLDPFMGSGTTCLACKHLGLDYIGFEINEKYYNIAKDRLNGINQKGEMNLFDLDYEERKD